MVKHFLTKYKILTSICFLVLLLHYQSYANIIGWKTYTTSDGLAGNTVLAIAIDAEGNKWFGTHNGGVSKFDGDNWKTYTTSDGLAGNTVYAIMIDAEGNKWFGTDGGVSRFDGKIWTTYTTSDGLVNNAVHDIATDSQGNVWVGTYGYGVFKFDGTGWKTYTTLDGLVDNDVRAIAADTRGKMWFGGGYDGRVSRFDGTDWTTFIIEECYSPVYAIAEDTYGNMWLGTYSQGVHKFDGTGWRTYTTSEGLAGNMVQAIAIDAEGNMWLGTYGSGVSKFDGTGWKTYTRDEGLASNYVFAIAADSQGNIWFGTDGGVSSFNGTDIDRWKTYTTSDGLAGNTVYAIAIAAEGEKWFGTDGGVSRFDGKVWTNYMTLVVGSKTNNDVRAIAEDSLGNMWFGTYGNGVHKFDRKKGIIDYSFTFSSLGSAIVFDIATDSRGIVWVGTYGYGVFKFDGTGWTNYTTTNGLAGNNIYSIAPDSRGNVWFGSREGKVSKFDGTSWITYQLPDLLYPVYAIAEDTYGNMWFGTYSQGVYKCHPLFLPITGRWEIYSDFAGYLSYDGTEWIEIVSDVLTTNCLGGPCVFSLSKDLAGNMWFGTDGGVSRFDGINWKLGWRTYTTSNGLAGNTVLAIAIDAEGNRWFGSDGQGVSIFPGPLPAPEFNIPNNSSTSPEISLSKVTLEIGNVIVGDTGTGSFTIKNEGTADLIITNIGSDNTSFMAALAPTLPMAIVPAKDSLIVIIKFLPNTLGLQNTKITVYSNDKDESALTISVSGKGVVAPEITLSYPDSIVPDTVNSQLIVADIKNPSLFKKVLVRVITTILQLQSNGKFTLSSNNNEAIVDSLLLSTQADSIRFTGKIPPQKLATVVRYQILVYTKSGKEIGSAFRRYQISPLRGKNKLGKDPVNLADLLRAVYLVLGAATPTIIDYFGLDLDQSGDFNTPDLIGILNIWRGTGKLLAGATKQENRTAKVSLGYKEIDKANATLSINLENNGSLDLGVFKIKYDAAKFVFGKAVATNRLGEGMEVVFHNNEAEGTYGVVVLNVNGRPISSGNGAILTIPVTAKGEKFDGTGDISLLSVGFEQDVQTEMNKEALSPKAILPKAFALSQNFPNPFNPSTTIAFDIPEGQKVHVTLNVYNMRGQLVRSLVNEVRNEGAYQIQWDGSDNNGGKVSSGVYFYRIKAGDFSSTRKMVILK